MALKGTRQRCPVCNAVLPAPGHEILDGDLPYRTCPLDPPDASWRKDRQARDK